MKVQREEEWAAQFQKLGLVTVTALAAWAKNAGWELTGEVYSIYLDVWEAKGKPRIVIPSTNLPARRVGFGFPDRSVRGWLVRVGDRTACGSLRRRRRPLRRRSAIPAAARRRVISPH